MAEPLAQHAAGEAAPVARALASIRLPAAIGCDEVAAAIALATAQLAATDEDPVRVGCEPVAGGTDARPALPTVAVLARLILAVRRSRRRVRLEDAPPALLELIDLCGLAELLADGPGQAPASGAASVAVDPV